MFPLLFDLLGVCIVGGLIYWVVLQLPLPEPFRKIAIVLVLVLFLLVLLSMLFDGGTIGLVHFGGFSGRLR